MCDINDINKLSFMRWKDDINNFLWDSYNTFLMCGKRWELKKCLNELKGTVGTYMHKDDCKYLINEFEDKLANFDKKETDK